MLGKHRHQNLVPLLCFCLAREGGRQEACLVYPLMPGGALDRALADRAARPLGAAARRLVDTDVEGCSEADFSAMLRQARDDGATGLELIETGVLEYALVFPAGLAREPAPAPAPAPEPTPAPAPEPTPAPPRARAGTPAPPPRPPRCAVAPRRPAVGRRGRRGRGRGRRRA